jgi:hypothetical protein
MKKHIFLLFFIFSLLFIFLIIKNIEIFLKIKTLIKIKKKSFELKKLKKLTQQQVFFETLLQTFDFIIVMEFEKSYSFLSNHIIIMVIDQFDIL